MSSDAETDDRDLADLIAAHTGRDAEEIRRASEEIEIGPLDEAEVVEPE